MQSFAFDEKSFKDQSDYEGEHIGVRLPCINANHLFQISSGYGRTQTRGSGK